MMFRKRNIKYVFLLYVVLLEKRVMGSEDFGDSSRTVEPPGTGKDQGQSSHPIPRIPTRSGPSQADRDEFGEHIKRGHTFLNQENYAEAISEFTKAIEKNPTISLGYKMRVKSLWKLGQWDNMINDIRIVLSKEPNNDEFRIGLRTALLNAGKYNEAIEAMIAHNDHASLAKLGNTFFDQKKMDDAFLCYNAAIDIKPEEPSYYQLRAKYFQRKQDFKSATSDYRKILEITPESEFDRAGLVDALFNDKQFDEAIKETFKLNASNFVALAQRFLAIGKFDAALLCCNEALKKEPKNDFFYLRRGTVHMRNKKLNLAIADFRKACSINNKVLPYRTNLIEALLESGKTTDAMNEMMALHADKLFDLAYSLSLEGKSKQATHCCTMAIIKDPQNEIHYRLRGNCYKKLADYSSAATDFKKVFELNPDQTTEFLIGFGELLLEVREYHELRTVLGTVSQRELNEDDSTKVENILRRADEIEKLQSQEPSATTGDFDELLTRITSTQEKGKAIADENRLVFPTVAATDVEMTDVPAGTSLAKTVDFSLERKRKKASNEEPSNIHSTLKNLLEARLNEDEFDILAKMWANELKGVANPQQLLFAKKAISDVIFEAQLGTLGRNSVTINPILPEDTARNAEN